MSRSTRTYGATPYPFGHSRTLAAAALFERLLSHNEESAFTRCTR